MGNDPQPRRPPTGRRREGGGGAGRRANLASQRHAFAPDGGEDRPLSLPPTPDLPPAAAVALLARGELRPIGRLLASSNNALLCVVSGQLPGGEHPSPRLEAPCVYKPIGGERPLWDFPTGTLAYREVAAYELSALAGWGIVPPTVLRDGPFGPGAVQLWITPDPAVDRLALVEAGDQRLRRIALFDAVVNNADRKIGHLLPLADGRILGVDHGVCFHVEPKLRTVLWHWRGCQLEPEEREHLAATAAALRGALGHRLGQLLSRAECRALEERLTALLRSGRFPHPSPHWPAIPWPPY